MAKTWFVKVTSPACDSSEAASEHRDASSPCCESRVPEAPGGHLGRGAAPGRAEWDSRAARHGVVSLPRIEGSLQDAQRLDQLRDDEVRVRVAVAVEVPALVDGNAIHRELDVLAFA